MGYSVSLSPLGYGAVIASVLIISYIYRLYSSSRVHFAPGPKSLPVIGNAHQLSMEQMELGLSEWANVYGDIVHIRVFQQPMVILNSLTTAQDLLDKRSSVYSDRPRFVLLSELMGWEHASTHSRYGPQFRKHRRFVNHSFSQRATAGLLPLQEKETSILLDSILTNPDSFMEYFRRFAGRTILKITYGYDVDSVGEVFFRLAERAIKMTLESGSPSATLVDFFPSMKHIPAWAPYAYFKRNANATKKAVEEMIETPYERVKADMRTKTAPPSYTSELLDICRDPNDGTVANEDEDAIKGSAGTLYAAAEDTTVSALETFILAMVLYPEVFIKVQKEMDQIVGNQRLPNLGDRECLPYFECVLKEALRWNPPVPLGLPHRLTEDDYYRGFFIPKGATVIANIHHISKACSDPDIFYPERYIRDATLPDPREFVFGFGRRKCPGRHFADSSIWLITAGLVSAFNITRAIDNHGNEIIPTLEFTNTFIRHPKPFKCSIKSRSEKSSTLIKRARMEAEREIASKHI